MHQDRSDVQTEQQVPSSFEVLSSSGSDTHAHQRVRGKMWKPIVTVECDLELCILHRDLSYPIIQL